MGRHNRDQSFLSRGPNNSHLGLRRLGRRFRNIRQSGFQRRRDFRIGGKASRGRRPLWARGREWHTSSYSMIISSRSSYCMIISSRRSPAASGSQAKGNEGCRENLTNKVDTLTDEIFWHGFGAVPGGDGRRKATKVRGFCTVFCCKSYSYCQYCTVSWVKSPSSLRHSIDSPSR
mgnify:FL=1